MHELSLIVAITEMITCDAALRGITRVTQVEIEVGELSGAFPYALKEAFPLATRNTIMENASLIVVDVPGIARCLSCAHLFFIGIHGWQCPNCARTAYFIESGTELAIRSYAGEDKDPQGLGIQALSHVREGTVNHDEGKATIP